MILTTTVIFVIMTTVPHVQTAVVTVAGLGRETDDHVGAAGVLLHFAVCVFTITTFSSSSTAPKTMQSMYAITLSVQRNDI